jgi:hypothetical protein
MATMISTFSKGVACWILRSHRETSQDIVLQRDFGKPCRLGRVAEPAQLGVATRPPNLKARCDRKIPLNSNY